MRPLNTGWRMPISGTFPLSDADVAEGRVRANGVTWLMIIAAAAAAVATGWPTLVGAVLR